jgi:hypothetical protein
LEDPEAQDDSSLMNIIPFLRALAIEAEDFRPIMREYNGLDADEIAARYQARLDSRRAQRNEKNNRGLGGLVRKKNVLLGRDRNANAGGSNDMSMISSKDIVGDAPSSIAEQTGGKIFGSTSGNPPPPPMGENAGALWQGLRRKMEASGEESRIRQEKWQQVVDERARKKKEREAQGGFNWPW